MTFFNLDASYAWLYPVITVPLTVIVVGAYMLAMARRNRKGSGDHSRDEEAPGEIAIPN